MASSAAVPIGFHYETKYVVLSYLGFPSQERPRAEHSISGAAAGDTQATGPPTLARDELNKVKNAIEEELKCLEEEISAAFPSTGFDMHTSPVFSPVNPESSVEECLAQLSEKLSLEIQEPVEKASEKLLRGSLTYEEFKKQADETSLLTSGWNKVLVPLVLLQRLLLELTRRREHRLESLVQLGVTYIEEVSSDYIVQQGGWGTVFSLVSDEEEVQGLIAEDSNDIYILPSDTSEQVSPPESLVVSESWHTESLPTTSLGPESWQQVVMDPEELKSLDSNEGAEERSENNSSNSDIVHVEKEEFAEVIAEAAVLGETQAEEEDEDEEREILVAPSAATPPPMATVPLEQTQERESPSPPALLPEPLKVEMVTKDEPAPIPPSLPSPPKEEIQLSSPSGPEQLEPPIPQKLSSSTPAAEEKPVLIEGKSILLYGGAAAVAILAVAVGMVMALRKK